METFTNETYQTVGKRFGKIKSPTKKVLSFLEGKKTPQGKDYTYEGVYQCLMGKWEDPEIELAVKKMELAELPFQQELAKAEKALTLAKSKLYKN